MEKKEKINAAIAALRFLLLLDKGPEDVNKKFTRTYRSVNEKKDAYRLLKPGETIVVDGKILKLNFYGFLYKDPGKYYQESVYRLYDLEERMPA